MCDDAFGERGQERPRTTTLSPGGYDGERAIIGEEKRHACLLNDESKKTRRAALFCCLSVNN